MDTSEDGNDRKQAAEQSLLSIAEPEEELKESKLGSGEIVLAAGEKRRQTSELQGRLIVQSKAAEHYSNGIKALEASQYEKAVICFSKAVTLKPDQAEVHVSQADAYLQLCDFHSAAACYRRAWLLEPGAFSARLAFIYYLQGQCLFERGLFSDALEAFRKAAEVKPGCRAHELRSLACLSAAGHHADCLQLVKDWMLSHGPTADLYTLRARLHKQLDQTSLCYQDVKSALALNPTCPHAGALRDQLQEASERARQKAVHRYLTGRLPEALCMINGALEGSPDDPRLHLFRGVLYRRLKDFTAAIEDLVQAVELSDESAVRGEEEEEEEEEEGGSLQQEVNVQLVLTYNEFAVACFNRGLYAEAALLLNKAVEEETGRAALYLNRGDCFFKQGEWAFALADYQQAEEMMRPDEPSVRLRLAVLYNTLGSLCFQNGGLQEAAEMFSLAVKYNPAAARYYENRLKAYRKLLHFDRARADLVCLLILDPTNEELPPLMMSLFPGRSESDVLSSPAAQAVKVELMETMKDCSSSCDQQRLSEKLQKITLVQESQSEEPSGAGQEGRTTGSKTFK